jgi:hypothetical protein
MCLCREFVFKGKDEIDNPALWNEEYEVPIPDNTVRLSATHAFYEEGSGRIKNKMTLSSPCLSKAADAFLKCEEA